MNLRSSSTRVLQWNDNPLGFRSGPLGRGQGALTDGGELRTDAAGTSAA